jgi:transposase-like protein
LSDPASCRVRTIWGNAVAGRRRYSDEERAAALAALAANRGNVARTARQVGLHPNTLRQWATGQRHPEATQMSEAKKESLADAFERLAGKMLGVADRKADDLGAKDAMISAGIAADKVVALRGGLPQGPGELVIRVYGPGLPDPSTEPVTGEYCELPESGQVRPGD